MELLDLTADPEPEGPGVETLPRRRRRTVHTQASEVVDLIEDEGGPGGLHARHMQGLRGSPYRAPKGGGTAATARCKCLPLALAPQERRWRAI